MKVRLLVCVPYQHSRVSLATCSSRSRTQPGTKCETCEVGAAAAKNTALPTAWPDGRAIEFRDVRVMGTRLGTDGLKVRGK